MNDIVLKITLNLVFHLAFGYSQQSVLYRWLDGVAVTLRSHMVYIC